MTLVSSQMELVGCGCLDLNCSHHFNCPNVEYMNLKCFYVLSTPNLLFEDFENNWEYNF